MTSPPANRTLNAAACFCLAAGTMLFSFAEPFRPAAAGGSCDPYGSGCAEVEMCCGGECVSNLLGCCNGMVYNPDYEGCCDGVVYNLETHCCL